MLGISVAAIAVAIGLLILAAGMVADERLSVQATKERLADYAAPLSVREDHLRDPFSTRVAAPAGKFIVHIVRQVAPAEYVERTRHRLLLAGRGLPRDVDSFLVARALCVAAIPILCVLLWKLSSIKGISLIAAFVFVILLGLLGPDAWLNRAVAERQDKIRLKLPDVLDLLTISVEAGLGFEQALARTVTMVPGPLSAEFTRMLGEMRAGASRSDALTALDERTKVSELRSFILALLQADTFGVSVGSILRNQAVEMRLKRRQRAQERAQKAPVKMLFPMVFCIMPALFVVIAGPAVISIYHAFHT